MKKVVIVSPIVCAPAYAGNTARVAQLVKILENLNVEIHFILAPNSTMYDQRNGNDMEVKFGSNYHILNNGQRSRGTLLNRVWTRLKKNGLSRFNFFFDYMLPWHVYDDESVNEFKHLVDDIQPEIIIGQYAITAQLIKALPYKIRSAVETHDCFTNRNKKIRDTGGKGMWWSLTSRQEKNLLSTFDYVIAIQKNEQNYFSQLLNDHDSEVVKIDVLELSDLKVDVNQELVNVGFLGSNNFHNREGLQAFIDKEWSKIKELVPNAKLLIAGDVQIDTTEKSIITLGRVSDVYEDFYKSCSIIVNPCVSGTGLKIKTVEAMTYGLPVVATPEGLSGIEEAIGKGAFLAELGAQEFPLICSKLLLDKDLQKNESTKSEMFIRDAYKLSISQIKKILTFTS
jgi:glycosyltransferase involved in cell wall biosynthesis